MATESFESEVKTVTIPVVRYEQLLLAEHRILIFNEYYQSQKYNPTFADVCSILGIPTKEEDKA